MGYLYRPPQVVNQGLGLQMQPQKSSNAVGDQWLYRRATHIQSSPAKPPTQDKSHRARRLINLPKGAGRIETVMACPLHHGVSTQEASFG